MIFLLLDWPRSARATALGLRPDGAADLAIGASGWAVTAVIWPCRRNQGGETAHADFIADGTGGDGSCNGIAVWTASSGAAIWRTSGRPLAGGNLAARSCPGLLAERRRAR